MNYLSVCSGIEAASAAWGPMGWKPVAFSEIDAFPCAYLKHHYPDVPNWGDMTKFKEWPDANVDVLVGGTPCQSFSVAGLRSGLADPRGNLMLTYLALAARYRPEWIVWENVPGVLSSNGGRDFGTFLGGLGQLGYGFAFRVLDAQHVRTRRFPWAVPQRRRRVFVVGHFGDWRRAAAVLFDRESMSGHSAPRRQAGKGFTHSVAGSIVGSGRGTERVGETRGQDPVVAMAHGQAGAEIAFGHGPTLTCNHEAPIVAHTLRGEGFDASEDGSGRGTPLVPCFPINTQMALRGADTSNTSREGVGIAKNGDPAFTLQAAHSHAVAYRTAGDGAVYVEGDKTAPLTTNTDQCAQVVAFDLRGREGGAMPEGPHDTANIRAASGGSLRSYVAAPWAVRRLTPRECERLQGFPDDATLIPYRKKPADKCPDGPRYKALGNSMAVNVVEWIGERIAEVDGWA